MSLMFFFLFLSCLFDITKPGICYNESPRNITCLRNNSLSNNCFDLCETYDESLYPRIKDNQICTISPNISNIDNNDTYLWYSNTYNNNQRLTTVGYEPIDLTDS